jgi:transcriptional regulator with XRE-family HTH domain
VDVSLLIRHRLRELGLEQKDLAVAAQVTESYISQLLARKKAPPAPGRTGLYERIGAVLELPVGELSRLADMQRREELRKRTTELPRPLFPECREVMLRKCDRTRQSEVRRIFEKSEFGELERLVRQTILTVTRSLAGLQTDVIHLSAGDCAAFLEPAVEWWDIDLNTFAIDVVLTGGSRRRFEFAEAAAPPEIEPGLEEFLRDPLLNGDATAEEIDFLRGLRFPGRKPSALYYYRELQSLRDPLHFRADG